MPVLHGALGRSRTADLLVRSQLLYPAELRARGGRNILTGESLVNPSSHPPQPISSAASAASRCAFLLRHFRLEPGKVVIHTTRSAHLIQLFFGLAAAVQGVTQKEVTKSEMAAAQAEVKVSESLTGIGKGMNDAGDAMRRAQDRTRQMEAKAVAMDGLMASGALSDPLDSRSQTEKELDEVRATSGVDDDLARLKAEMAKDKGTPGSGAGGA